MALLAVVEDFEVLEERGPGLSPCGEPGSVRQFGLERAEEALHRRIVEAIALAAHGSFDAMEPKTLAVGAARLLHPAI
jgi:hypothetical protein